MVRGPQFGPLVLGMVRGASFGPLVPAILRGSQFGLVLSRPRSPHAHQARECEAPGMSGSQFNKLFKIRKI